MEDKKNTLKNEQVKENHTASYRHNELNDDATGSVSGGIKVDFEDVELVYVGQGEAIQSGGTVEQQASGNKKSSGPILDAADLYVQEHGIN